MARWIIDEGSELLTGSGLLTSARVGSTTLRMDLDELFPSKPDDPLVALAKQGKRDAYDHIVRLMQEALDALAAERRFPVLG